VAQVPVYGGPQVRSNALQPVQQREIDVSSGMRALAGALGNVGGEIDKVVRRDAETEANRVDTEITAGWLQWDAKARQQYRGQNVGEYEVEAAKWWDKASETYGKDLSPLAQRAISQQLGRKRNQAMGSVLGHVNSEKERFADDSAEAAAQTSIDFAVDTGDTAGAASQVRKIAAEKGARKGWTTEMVQAEQQRLLGTLHLAYISTLAERDAAKASTYYTASKGEIPASAQARVEQVLKAEGDNQFAKAEAARVYALPADQRAEALAKISDPDRLTKTRAEFNNIAAVERQAQVDRERGASDQAWQMVGQGKRVPERVLMQMNGRERVTLQDYLKDRAKQAASGETVKTDWKVYIDAREKLFSDDPAVRDSVNLQALTTKIAGPQLEQLLDIKTKRNNPGKTVEVATSEQQIGSFTRQMDLKGEKLGQFQAAAYDLFNEHLKAKGKEPTYDERQAILDKLVQDVVIKPGWIWDTRGPAYTAPRDVRNAAMKPDQFTVGKVYTDAKNNRAKYLGGGKWEPVK
jgi:hypothetical protein